MWALSSRLIPPSSRRMGSSGWKLWTCTGGRTFASVQLILEMLGVKLSIFSYGLMQNTAKSGWATIIMGNALCALKRNRLSAANSRRRRWPERSKSYSCLCCVITSTSPNQHFRANHIIIHFDFVRCANQLSHLATKISFSRFCVPERNHYHLCRRPKWRPTQYGWYVE